MAAAAACWADRDAMLAGTPARAGGCLVVAVGGRGGLDSCKVRRGTCGGGSAVATSFIAEGMVRVLLPLRSVLCGQLLRSTTLPCCAPPHTRRCDPRVPPEAVLGRRWLGGTSYA